MRLFGVVALILFLHTGLRAESKFDHIYIDHDAYVELDDDLSMFKFYDSDSHSHNDDIFRYLYPSSVTKRRGVDWWQLRRVSHPFVAVDIESVHTLRLSSAKVFASNLEYSFGAALTHASSLRKGWGVEGNIFVRTGRDSGVEGMFRNDFNPSVAVTRSFADNHHLRLALDIPYQMRGLRSSATEECFELTNNNLYNPSWGYSDGKVRNSRVVRNLLPEFTARYQRNIAPSTIVAMNLVAEYGTRKLSRLGWYDASNPMPNYYSKLPSNFVGSSAYDIVEESWRQNDTRYTQIAWEKLESINRSSSDGSSHYTVEDQAERVADVDLDVLFDTQLSDNLNISYGGAVEHSSRRYYKQMRDLLGGEYLLDIDYYADDMVSTATQFQNNLRAPNRRVTEGERFGYDYTLSSSAMEATVQVDYHTSRTVARLRATIGEESIRRQGHYETERFAGAGSYGDSPEISLNRYSLHASWGYMLGLHHSVAVRLGLDSEAPLARYLFINEQVSNRIVDRPTTEKILFTELEYRYTASRVELAVEGYLISCRDGWLGWQGYDDLSSIFCDVVVSDVATRSCGVEISGEFRVGHRWRLKSAVALGGALYTSSPLVTLYDDNDLSVVAESRASGVEGYIVGNAPQISAKVESRYFGLKGFVLGVDLYSLAMRYASPSIQRRTNRIIGAVTSPESRAEILTQERLPPIIDGAISFTKSFELQGANKITLHANVKNIIGSRNMVASAYEGNRILGCYASDLLYGYRAQEPMYRYLQGRHLYLSLGYQF